MSENYENQGLIRAELTDESIDLMRNRIGLPNPCLRSGIVSLPWNTTASMDAFRKFAMFSLGSDDPMYIDADYAKGTRWGEPVAPVCFEVSMGINRSPRVPAELEYTRKALSGVQLFHSGGEIFYYAPIRIGTTLYRSRWVARVDVKPSQFAGRSVIVTNGQAYWDQNDCVVARGEEWFIHAERRERSNGKYAADEPAFYTDEQIEEIEAAYDAEYRRGPETLYLEDVKVGDALPRMVKGPLTITDLINYHMGAGWLSYGNPPYRLAYENRKKLRGFYTRDEYNWWDTLQRVHWDRELARRVGVAGTYDIGPMRQAMVASYVMNYAGNNAFVHRLRFELRRFNYMGDITWLTGKVIDVRVDPQMGPAIDIEIQGVNQRGHENVRGGATILVDSREFGPWRPPVPPGLPEYRA